MSAIIDYLFGAASFVPHGYCLLWRPDLVAMHAISDILIALSYFSIPAAIHVFLTKRGDLQFGWLAWLFVGFISACGLTHLIGLITLWQPVYGLQGLVKVGTAGISVVTAILMWPLLPKLLAIPSPSMLRDANERLQGEIAQRLQAEGRLKNAQAELELRVEERTKEIKRTNAKLARLNAEHEQALLRLESILDNSVDALITINESGTIENYNRACKRIFGYSPHEALGQNVKMLMNLDDAAQHDGFLASYITSGDAKIIGVGREVMGRHKDGSLVPLDLSVSEIRLANHRLFSGILRDISERKQAEEQREQLVEQLRASNHELEQFAYVASHDLRAPLRALAILPKWARRDLEKSGGLIPSVDDHLSDMHKQIDRMDKLLSDLLEYSRAGRGTKKVEKIHPGSVVENVRELLQVPPNFKLSAEANLPAVEANPTEFEIVIRNLISNALKHHDRDHGEIIIRGGYSGNRGFIEVADDGPGIPPEFHERIFEMFSTLRSRDEVEGSGMGLALIKKIVERWGGTVSVLSRAGERGTTFRFTFPAQSKVAA